MEAFFECIEANAESIRAANARRLAELGGGGQEEGAGVSGQAKEQFLETRLAIADYLGIDPKTLDAWRARYHAKSANPLPIGKQGKGLITTKAKLDAWRAWFVDHV